MMARISPRSIARLTRLSATSAPKRTLTPSTSRSGPGAPPVTRPPARPQRLRGSSRRRGSCRSGDRKSTRLNSSHTVISYAVICLKKKIDDRVLGEATLDAELRRPDYRGQLPQMGPEQDSDPGIVSSSKDITAGGSQPMGNHLSQS